MTKILSVHFWIISHLNKNIVHNFVRLTFVNVEMNQISITAFQKRHNKDC